MGNHRLMDNEFPYNAYFCSNGNFIRGYRLVEEGQKRLIDSVGRQVGIGEFWKEGDE